MTTKTEQAVQALALYHDLLAESDQATLMEVAARALRKAVKLGKAQITSVVLVADDNKKGE